SRSQFVESKINSGRIVIDCNCRRAEEPLKEQAGVDVTFSATAGSEVVLQIGVAGKDGRRTERGGGEVGEEVNAGGGCLLVGGGRDGGGRGEREWVRW